MQNNDISAENEKIKEILDKISEENAAAKITDGEGGSMEFDFSRPMPKTSLVFEQTEDAEAAEAEDLNISAPVTTSETVEAEASVSDTFFAEADKATDGGGDSADYRPEASPMIWKTYVPSFTEATQRTYSFMDEEAYERKKKESGQVLYNKAAALAEDTGARDVDPTAEIDSGEELDAAVVVNVNNKEPERHSSASVFKFSEETEGRHKKTPEELEMEELDELFGRNKKPEAEMPEDGAEVNVEDVDGAPQGNEEDAFNIPDPLRLFDMSERGVGEETLSEEELPRGAGVEPGKNPCDSKVDYFGKRDLFKDKFLDKIMATRLRMIIVVLLGVLTLAYELLPVFGVDPFALVGIKYSHPLSVSIDLCLLFCMYALTLPETVRGFAAIRRKILAPELSLTFSALAIAVYSILCISLSNEGIAVASLFVIPAVNAVYSTYCIQWADFADFKLVSENGEKYAVDVRNTRELDRENMALDGAVNEYESKLARDFSASFISDFFENSSRNRENNVNNGYIYLLIVIAGALSAFVAYITGGGIADAAFALCLTFTLGQPAFFILSHKLPRRLMESEIVEDGSAAIGEETYYDLGDVDVVTFEDTEIFGEDDVVFKSVTISDKNGDYRKVMRKMASLFLPLGGPLAELFLTAFNKQCQPAEDIIIEDDGVSGIVDGSKVMAGSFEYMRRHGVQLPPESASNLASTKTMYGAEDGAIFAKFSIQYSFSESFARMMSSLIEGEIIPLVYTRDPNINNDLMNFLSGGKVTIKVMRKNSTAPKYRPLYKSLSAPAVSFGDKNDIVNMVVRSKDYCIYQSKLSVFELVAACIGTFAAVGLALFGAANPLIAAGGCLWQLTLGVCLFASGNKALIRKGK